jgi:hypothetical protein
VIITASGTDSEGKPLKATAKVVVYVKRAHSVSLYKSSDSDATSKNLEVSPGSQFTISGYATGNQLGITCDGCGEDVSKDKTVVESASQTGWAVLEGADLVTIGTCTDGSAEFTLSRDAQNGDVIKIRATSWLSVKRGYGNEGSDNGFVTGVIELKVVSDDDVENLGSLLRYGEQTLAKGLGKGMTTDHARLVECIRVVDNSGKQADKVLVHYTVGGGYDIRIVPDLFDLDLNGNYTFYIQILDPVSIENRKLYNEGKTDGKVIEDDAETIWAEYQSHLSSRSPYGYVGTKYNVTKVYSQVLQKPKVTFTYNGVEYKAKKFTMDTINVLDLGNGASVVSEIKPSRLGSTWSSDDDKDNDNEDRYGYESLGEDDSPYENVEANAGMNGMRYSVYEGEGDDPANWTPLYVFNGDTKQYEGTNTVANGAMSINPGGNPFFKTNNVTMDICGTYHIVPGMLYQNQKSDDYEIIGYMGFEYNNLTYEEKYYDLSESTITVKIDKVLTMTINTTIYKGQVAFPLPTDSTYASYFADSTSTAWKERDTSIWIKGIKDGSETAESVEIGKVRYRYIAKEDAYEVEPILTVNNALFSGEYSCGVYKCIYGAAKWTQISAASPKITSKVTLDGMIINGKEYVAKVPLPSDSDFWFTKGVESPKPVEWQNVVFYDASDGTGNTYVTQGFTKITCEYNPSTQVYTIEFLYKTGDDWDGTKVIDYWQSYGVYTCSATGSKWTLQKSAYTFETYR